MTMPDEGVRSPALCPLEHKTSDMARFQVHVLLGRICVGSPKSAGMHALMIFHAVLTNRAPGCTSGAHSVRQRRPLPDFANILVHASSSSSCETNVSQASANSY